MLLIRIRFTRVEDDDAQIMFKCFVLDPGNDLIGKVGFRSGDNDANDTAALRDELNSRRVFPVTEIFRSLANLGSRFLRIEPLFIG